MKFTVADGIQIATATTDLALKIWELTDNLAAESGENIPSWEEITDKIAILKRRIETEGKT